MGSDLGLRRGRFVTPFSLPSIRYASDGCVLLNPGGVAPRSVPPVTLRFGLSDLHPCCRADAGEACSPCRYAARVECVLAGYLRSACGCATPTARRPQLVAGDNGISVQKYATADEYAELRGITTHVPVAVDAAPASPPPPRSVVRKGKGTTKTKENTVFVVHGRDAKLRDAMYQFLGALGLKPQEWGHAIRAASRKGGNPYVNEAVTKIMEQAQAIVVLLTPDDEAKLKEQFVGKHERQSEGKLRGQARPNVIFKLV